MVEQGGDPPVAVSGSRIGDRANGGEHIIVALAPVIATRLADTGKLLDQIGACHGEGVGRDLHREASVGGDGNCKAGFFPGRR